MLNLVNNELIEQLIEHQCIVLRVKDFIRDSFVTSTPDSSFVNRHYFDRARFYHSGKHTLSFFIVLLQSEYKSTRKYTAYKVYNTMLKLCKYNKVKLLTIQYLH